MSGIRTGEEPTGEDAYEGDRWVARLGQQRRDADDGDAAEQGDRVRGQEADEVVRHPLEVGHLRRASFLHVDGNHQRQRWPQIFAEKPFRAPNNGVADGRE